MRFSSWLLAAVTATVAIAAVAQEKKQAAPPAQTKAAQTKAAQPKPKSGDGQTQPSDEKPAAESQADEQPAKKSPPRGPGIKVATDDEASLLKTLSYMQGYGIGKNVFDQFKEQGIELDEEVLLAAFKDGLAGKDPAMTEEAMKKVLPQVEKYVSEKYAAKAKERGGRLKAEGEAFLAENKKKEGVKTLPSGLQYKVLKSGSGETPKKSDTVKVHYKGSLLNGTEFDSSYKRGAPAPLQLNRVIKGWAEALQLMKVGDKWQLFVPSELAYEEQGRHDQQGHEIIPPNSTLVFEVELLGIESGRKAAAPPSLK